MADLFVALWVLACAALMVFVIAFMVFDHFGWPQRIKEVRQIPEPYEPESEELNLPRQFRRTMRQIRCLEEVGDDRVGS